jgi:hypothetical protein
VSHSTLFQIIAFRVRDWECLIKAENAHIVPGQDTTGAAGLGVKALLAKKMAKAK